jgi:ribosome-binding factor A
LLKHLVPEALGTLDDLKINSLNVTDVLCSKGRYDAKVFIDPEEFVENERNEVMQKLKRVSAYITEYIKDTEGWYRAPNFIFEFDDNLQRINKMEKLFKQIETERDIHA